MRITEEKDENNIEKDYLFSLVDENDDELDKQHQFVDLGYGVMIVGNTLSIRYGKEYKPRQSRLVPDLIVETLTVANIKRLTRNLN